MPRSDFPEFWGENVARSRVEGQTSPRHLHGQVLLFEERIVSCFRSEIQVRLGPFRTVSQNPRGLVPHHRV